MILLRFCRESGRREWQGNDMYTYVWCFFIFAFLGWCSEVAFAAVRDRHFVNRGFLNGPLCPIYGFGVVLIDFIMRPFGGNLAALLVGSMVPVSYTHLSDLLWCSAGKRCPQEGI